ncbi:MAG: ketopantoate reductase family protein [Bacteroidaceae bacterium]|jgi:2-dehydropantoate 2-reductase
MKCLIVGTGGVGGSLAAFLALAGHEVCCIARGEHLRNMLRDGLKFHSDLKGEVVLPVYVPGEEPHAAAGDASRVPYLTACTSDDYRGTADLVLVCVKGYSISSVAECIVRAARPDSIVLPVLNVFGTGPRIAAACPGARVIDGCIYIVGFVNAPGEITQMGSVLKLVFGARSTDGVSREELERLQRVLQETGIKAILSDDIVRDTFAKWGFISAMACTGAYYDVPMGALQHPGPERDTFIGLTRESSALGEKLGVVFREDPVEANLRVIDALDPMSTASLQKDLNRGHESEIQGQLFDLIDAARAHGVETPTYDRVARKFGR